MQIPVKTEVIAKNADICTKGKFEDGKIVKVSHRVAAYFQARLAFTMAAFNLLVQWQGLPADGNGFVPLSIAEFSL